MTVRRASPYVWATWLSKLLVGDLSCEWPPGSRPTTKTSRRRPVPSTLRAGASRTPCSSTANTDNWLMPVTLVEGLSRKAGNSPNEWRKTALVTKEGQLYLKPAYAFATIRDAARHKKKGKGSTRAPSRRRFRSRTTRFCSTALCTVSRTGTPSTSARLSLRRQIQTRLSTSTFRE
jgi:hypothetical protein